MASENKSKSKEGSTRYIWKGSRVSARLRLTRLGILAAMSLVSIGCSNICEREDIDPLTRGVCTCGMQYGNKAKLSIAAKYEDLKKGGEVEVEAAEEAGSLLLDMFDSDEARLKAYAAYCECLNPFIEDYLSADEPPKDERPKDERPKDERPKVVLVGSREDYRDYNLKAFEATSVELLHSRFGGTFKIDEFTVSYGTNIDNRIRNEKEKPAVIVMHASAFHNDEYVDEAVDKFQSLVTSLYEDLRETKFVIFSRLPEDPSPDTCRRWERQVNFLRAKEFRERLVFYPLLRKESDFRGKAGQEICDIVRCLSGLQADEFCSMRLGMIEKQTQQRIALVSQSRCQ